MRIDELNLSKLKKEIEDEPLTRVDNSVILILIERIQDLEDDLITERELRHEMD